jgi:hypothetical protein
VVDAIGSGDMQAAKERKLILFRAIRQSPDLTATDRDMLKAKAEALMHPPAGARAFAAPPRVIGAGLPRSLAVAMRLAREQAGTVAGGLVEPATAGASESGGAA